MRVLFVASEAAPFAKTGGLADVAGALPSALARLGCDVTLVIPAYRDAIANAAAHSLPIEPTGMTFGVPIGTLTIEASILRSRLPGKAGAPSPEVLLVANDDCFDRPTLYGGPVDYPDNAARFTFFSRAVMELLSTFSDTAPGRHSRLNGSLSLVTRAVASPASATCCPDTKPPTG